MEHDAASILADIRKYEDTLAKDPASYCFAPLAELYRKMGNLDDAIATAQRGCELHPDYVGGFMALGRAYYEKGMKAESRAPLERVVDITPDNLLALKLLSHLYLELGVNEAAGKALRSILAQNPDDHESKALLDSLANADDVVEELEIIEELSDEDLIDEDEYTISLEPTAATEEAAAIRSPISTSTLAELYVSQGFLTHALTIYREMLAADPDNADLERRVDELTRTVAEEGAGEAAVPGEEAEQTGGVMSTSPETPPAAVAMPVPSAEDRVVQTLEKWLDTIRRRQ